MTPALPRRLTLGLLPTAVLLTLTLALAGTTSSGSAPLARPLPPLDLSRFFPELSAPLLEPFITAAATPDAKTAIVEAAALQPSAGLAARPEAGQPPEPQPITAMDIDRYLSKVPFGREIGAVAAEHHLDGLLIASVVEAESSFRPDAVSPRGALGLMQLMPLHLEGVEEPLDPHVNLELGAGYLARLEHRFGGDLELALAAYHAGPTAVARSGGIPTDGSTPQYVSRVLTLYREHQAQLQLGTTELR